MLYYFSKIKQLVLYKLGFIELDRFISIKNKSRFNFYLQIGHKSYFDFVKLLFIPNYILTDIEYGYIDGFNLSYNTHVDSVEVRNCTINNVNIGTLDIYIIVKL